MAYQRYNLWIMPNKLNERIKFLFRDFCGGSAISLKMEMREKRMEIEIKQNKMYLRIHKTFSVCVVMRRVSAKRLIYCLP